MQDVSIRLTNEPGALAGINIEVLYSDHDHQLVLVVDKPEEARSVSAAWASEA